MNALNLNPLVDRFFKLLEFLVVACLVAMVIMVFGNVVLRWVFNSGIMVSEEMSRYCFMWLTYIGAMVAMRENGHLGVDTLVRRLPLGGKKFCVLTSECLMLFCNVLFFIGTWKMHELQVTNVSPVVGISMIWIYGIGYIVGVVMGLFNLNRLYRLLTGRMTEDEMVMVVDAEGLKEAEETIKHAEAKNAESKQAKQASTPPTAAHLAGSKA